MKLERLKNEIKENVAMVVTLGVTGLMSIGTLGNIAYNHHLKTNHPTEYKLGQIERQLNAVDRQYSGLTKPVAPLTPLNFSSRVLNIPADLLTDGFSGAIDTIFYGEPQNRRLSPEVKILADVAQMILLEKRKVELQSEKQKLLENID